MNLYLRKSIFCVFMVTFMIKIRQFLICAGNFREIWTYNRLRGRIMPRKTCIVGSKSNFIIWTGKDRISL